MLIDLEVLNLLSTSRYGETSFRGRPLARSATQVRGQPNWRNIMNKPTVGQVLNAISILMNNADWDAIPTPVLQKIIDNPRDSGREFTTFLKEGAHTIASHLAPVNHLRKIINKVELPATNGTRTIAKAKQTFTGYLDVGFKNLDVSSLPTPATPIEVYEQVKDGTFAAIFGSVGRNLDDLCFTQEQIISFAEGYPNLLHPESYGTFFLFKVNGEYFVANVLRYSGERLSVHVRRFARDSVWSAEDCRRVVLPQLTTSPT